MSHVDPSHTGVSEGPLSEDPRHLPASFGLRGSCASAHLEANERLRRLCARKVNRLSCRCAVCRGDERLPVLATPADAPLVNTGFDGSGGALPAGATDALWEVGLGDGSGPASVTSWIPAFVVATTSWTPSPFGNASWISFFADTRQGEGNVDAYFRAKFNLASSVDPAAFVLLMDFFADNCVFEIYVNQVAQSGLPSGAAVLPQGQAAAAAAGQAYDPYDWRGFDAGSAVQITLDNHWRECENEIVVHVKSGSPQMGFLAQNSSERVLVDDPCGCERRCREVELPRIRPCITVTWGDTRCDCMETDDVEVLCITVCNTYSNVTFRDLSIASVLVTDLAGNAVAALPDGTPSVQAIPSGPICFGDVGPCVEGDRPSCVSRELVLYTRGAAGRRYKLIFGDICFRVCHEYRHDQCFTFDLCQD